MKKIFAFTLFLIGCALTAQETKNELNASIGYGISSLDYILGEGELEKGNGPNIQLAYFHYLSPKLAIGTGVAFQAYRSNIGAVSLSDTYTTVDADGESFEYRYTLKGLLEKQYVNYLQVPLLFRLETEHTNTRLYMVVGAKAGVALTSEYRTKASKLTTSGHYPQHNATLNGPTFAGFGDLGPIDAPRRDLALKTAFSLAMEVGAKHRINHGQWLYLGVYVDIGRNDLREETHKNLVDYDPDNGTSPTIGTILETDHSNSVSLMALGIKLGYGMGW